MPSAAMGPIPHCKERILVKIKFECRPVLMSKYHDSLLFMVLNREALDRLCVRLNMYLVEKRFCCFKSDRDEIWQECSSSKYTHPW